MNNDPIADALTFPPVPQTSEAEAYEAFVDSMIRHCHCHQSLRPCDGVLAGGLCDNDQGEREDDDDHAAPDGDY